MKYIISFVIMMIFTGCPNNYRVIDMRDNPIAGAKVYVKGKKFDHFETITDSNGVFKIDSLQINGLADKKISVEYPGYFEGYYDLERRDDRVIRLVPLNNPTANPGVIYKRLTSH